MVTRKFFETLGMTHMSSMGSSHSNKYLSEEKQTGS